MQRIITVTSMHVEVVEDSYEKGEIGRGWTRQDERVAKRFTGWDGVFAWAKRDHGLSDDPKHWCVFADGMEVGEAELSTGVLEDSDSYKMEQGTEKYKQWEANRIKGYRADYHFRIRIENVEPTALDLDEIRTLGMDIQ